MATRLPRCFAAAAATAAAASATATSGTPAGNTNAGQASRRRRNGQEEEEEAKDRRGPHCRLPASAFPEKIGYASSAKHCGGNNVRPSIDAEGRPSPSWKDVIASVRLGRVAYADATGFPSVVEEAERGGVGAGGDAVLPSLEEGEKPEFIQRADEQAEQMKNQLRRPSQFPDQFGEVSQITQVHSFDGFRLDMSKAITPTFFTSHNIFFGNSQFPGGHYQGMMTVVGENETMVRASSDAEGNVNMDLHAPLGLPTLSGKVSIRQGKSELLQGTVVYSGDSWVGQVSAGTEPVDICYNQAVTQRLSIGGQGQFSAAQRAVGLLYGFKYNTPSWAVLGRFIGGGANVVTAQYLRRVVPGRVSLAAEYQAQLGAGSQMMIGAEFVLKQSKMSASLDSNGKVDSALELKCGTFPTLPVTLTLSSSLDHLEDKHTFGLALTCGQ